MVKRMTKLKVIAPIGKTPSIDKKLHDSIKALPDDSSIADVFREISKWEKVAVLKSRERERSAKSGQLDVVCR